MPAFDRQVTPMKNVRLLVCVYVDSWSFYPVLFLFDFSFPDVVKIK